MSSQTRATRKIIIRALALLLALLIRDTKAERGGVTEADWARINELLKESWRSLAKAVKA